MERGRVTAGSREREVTGLEREVMPVKGVGVTGGLKEEKR